MQIEQGIARFNKKVGERFVIYFQAYTNTYGDPEYLKRIWTNALDNSQVVGISIATRPDCLPEEILNLLSELRETYHKQNKFIWVELGLQTMHEDTARQIHRGYELPVYEEAVEALYARGIATITHIIFGLPGETREDMLATVRYVGELLTKREPHPGTGVKLQLLHILKDTDLAKDYLAGKISPLSMESYFSLLADALRILPDALVIHRLTGDGPKKLLLAPEWSANKRLVLNSLTKYLNDHY